MIQVESGIDYRRRAMEKVQVYHSPLGPEADRALEAVFANLADVVEEHHPLMSKRREIPYVKRAGGLVWFDFGALCGGMRSYTDYVDLTVRFHTVILSNIPRMGPRNADSARRFTWLVDVFYDERVKLVCFGRNGARWAVYRRRGGEDRGSGVFSVPSAGWRKCSRGNTFHNRATPPPGRVRSDQPPAAGAFRRRGDDCCST